VPAVKSQDEIGALATAFGDMTTRLQQILGTLEQRVADRTKALATSSEVSRRLSTILNQKELVIEVVEQVKEAFGYYHAHIYLVEGDELAMAGGTGDAGAAMLADGHKLPKGRGLVGRAAESNEPVLVSNTTQDPDWLPNPLLPETKSELAVPISIGDRVLGVLDVQHDVTDGRGQEDVDALQSIANQVAVAIQNINQYEKTQKVAADLGVVANVGIATSTITEADRLLQEVVDLSKQSFGLYHAHIYMLNAAGDTLELASGAGAVGRKMVAEGRAIPLDSEKSLVARAARGQEGVVVNDVRTDPDFLPNPLLPETRAEMAVPMLVSGKVIGVLDVQSEQVNRFTDTDVNIQTTLASQVAVALQNARSLAAAQKQAERETTLNTIAQKIQGTATIEEAMQIAARELGHALGKRQTLVALDAAALAGDGKGVVTE
jgi:GAF domain-containing protein